MSDSLRVRDRWVMGNEARWLVVVTSVLLAFGLATLYSASAIVAMNDGHAGWYYAGRQALGVVLVFRGLTEPTLKSPVPEGPLRLRS